MPKGIPLTKDEIVQRRREIGQAAVELVVKNGYVETSMRMIAAAANVGKSTLYDYFPSKEDLILYMVHEHMTGLIQRARTIMAQEGSAAERLRRVMKMHLNYILTNKGFFLRMFSDTQFLKEESQKRIQVERYAYQDLVQDLIEQGIAEGNFRRVKPTMAMKTLISMMTPVIFTSRPIGTPEEMLEAGLDVILKGLEK